MFGSLQDLDNSGKLFADPHDVTAIVVVDPLVDDLSSKFYDAGYRTICIMGRGPALMSKKSVRYVVARVQELKAEQK